MAQKTFRLTEYDYAIYSWFSKNKKLKDIKLRYGENPNQKAILKTAKKLKLNKFTNTRERNWV